MCSGVLHTDLSPKFREGLTGLSLELSGHSGPDFLGNYSAQGLILPPHEALPDHI